MKYINAVIAIVFILAGIWFYWPSNDTPEERSTNSTETTDLSEQQTETATFDKTQFSLIEEDSLWLIVNKDRPISMDYQPQDLRDVGVELFPGKSLDELKLRDEAATALESMFAAAKLDGIDLMLGSGHRSYQVQKFYYDNYVATFGQEEADRFSARPGTSEHQTGLAADVVDVDQLCYLEICFEDTDAGVWVAQNAHQFGFIIRYQVETEEITGYQYEPWHLRYVGTDLSEELFSTPGIVLEEFFDI